MMKYIKILIILFIIAGGVNVFPQVPVTKGLNRVLDLDGDNSYFELPSRIFDELDESTIEMWVQWFDLHHMADIFDFGRDGTEMLLATRSYAELEFKFNVGIGERELIHPIRVHNILRTNEWCHIAAVSGPKGMQLYFNGYLVGKNSYSGSFRTIAPGDKNYIGRDNAKGWGRFSTFHGQMDEFRVWGVARTEQQIRDNMTRSLTGKETGLFGLWNFEDGTARDGTIHQNHGKLIGKARVISGTLPDRAPAPPRYIIRGRVFDSEGNKIKFVETTAQLSIYHDGLLLDKMGLYGDQEEYSIVVDGWPEPFDLAVVDKNATGWKTGVPKKETSAGPIDIQMTSQTLSGRILTLDSKPLPSVVVQAIRVSETPVVRIKGLRARFYGTNEIFSSNRSQFENISFPVIKPGVPPLATSIDRFVNFSKENDAAYGNKKIDSNYAIWNGILHVEEKSKYSFYVESGGCVRLSIDHDRLMDQEGLQSSGRSIDLEVGDHLIELECFQPQGLSRCGLLWERDGLKRQIITEDHLFSETANITSTLSTNSMATDSHGRYSFVDLQPGKYQLRAQVGNEVIPLGNQTVEVRRGRSIRGLEHRVPPVKAGEWKQYTRENGLPSDDILAVRATPDGLVWVGTTAGIARFDGERFLKFTTEHGLLDDAVRSVFRDRDGGLWFGSSRGVSRMRVRNQRQIFDRFPLEVADPADGIRSILQASDGRIWVAGSRGLSWFDGETFRPCPITGGPSNPNRMTLDSSGVIWMTSNDGDLWKFDGQRFQRVDIGRIFTNQSFDSPTIDARGNVWFTMSMRGIGCYRPSSPGDESLTLTEHDGFPNSQCQTLHAAGDGSLWFGFADRGAVRYNNNSIIYYNSLDGLSSDRVNDICSSLDGTVWFATDKGVFKFNPRSAFTRFDKSDGVPSLSTRASLAAKDGTVWFGQSAGDDPDVLYRGWNEVGLVRYHTNGFHDVVGIPVNKIKESPDGAIWFATPDAVADNGGARRWEGGRWTVLRKGMPTGLVLDLGFENSGSIWFAHGSYGVSRYDPKASHLNEGAFEVFNLESTHLTAPVASILHAKDHSTWLGSSGGGVSRYKDGKFNRYGKEEGFIASQVRDIFQIADGSIWFATEMGVIRYDGERFISIDRSKGRLINNDVLSIYQDSRQTLWFGTRAGVTRFDGQAWSSLDHRDWGVGKEVRTICQDLNGSYWFGTDQGIIRYVPEYNKPNPPSLMVQTDKTYEDISSIPPILRGTQVTFHFNTINTIQRAEARRYRYQMIRGTQAIDLSNVKEGWIYLSQDSQARWQASEAGSFVLIAQYMDRDLNYSEPTSVSFKVVDPWYLNPWVTVPFGTGMVSMLVVGAFAGVQYSRKRREADGLRKQILEQDLESRRALEAKALALAESNHQLDLALEAAEVARAHADSANQSKSQFLANMSHELRTPLNAIIGYSEMLQEEAEDLGVPEINPDLHKINRAGKHLLGLINDILDLSKIEAGKMTVYLENFDVRTVVDEVAAMVEPLVKKNGNRLTLEVTPGVGEMRADVTKVRQTLFNLLSNACKFTDQGMITVKVSRVGSNVVFDVIDNGIGMTPSQLGRLFQAFSQADASTTKKYGGTGLGLALSRKFCQIMGGDMTVTSESGKGSTFTATIPAEVRENAPDTR